jgi:hypothetical protein
MGGSTRRRTGLMFFFFHEGPVNRCKEACGEVSLY